jgi:LysM repeat protein
LADSDKLAAESLQLAETLVAKLRHFFSDQVTPIRLASHLAVLIVAAVVLIFNQVEIPDWEVPLRNIGQGELALQNSLAEAVPAPVVDYVVSQNSFTPDLSSSLQRAAVPITTIQNRQRQAIELYSVQSGDTVLGIAAQFGINPETIQWANPGLEANPDLLRIGDRLTILPVDGVLHRVQTGDTLSTIATKYKVTPADIVALDLNKMESPDIPLSLGQEIVVPGGQKPYVAKRVVAYNGPIPQGATRGTGVFAWPATGRVTQQYWNGHRAVDIGAWVGTPVKAADSGYVINASNGWNDGYGNMVIIDHGNGFVSLYSHLNSVYVRQGENVAMGEQIGTVGNTGNSTGSHLHFEIRYQGIPRNPFGYLQ